MCLIIVKPFGVNMLPEIFDVIKGASTTNRDGFGFASKTLTSNHIYIDKGYMDVDKIIDRLKLLKYNEDDELVIHLRARTDGKISPQNCHPFVVSDNENILNTLEGMTKLPVLAHNGMINIKTIGDYSDTWTWVKTVFSNPNINKAFLDSGKDYDARVVQKWFPHGKLAILSPESEVQLIGSWQEKNGVYYSNSGYSYYVKHSKKSTVEQSYNCAYDGYCN